jgi:hypothetical protein
MIDCSSTGRIQQSPRLFPIALRGLIVPKFENKAGRGIRNTVAAGGAPNSHGVLGRFLAEDPHGDALEPVGSGDREVIKIAGPAFQDGAANFAARKDRF